MISALRNTSTPNPFAASTAPTDPPVGPAEPSAPKTSDALSTASKLGRDEFLKLLVAQMKNQDPLNPMDGKDMAAQLAQFSSVEQLMQLNKSIDAQGEAQQAIADALGQLSEDQKAQGDELAALIEGQMAVATVGKIGVTSGKGLYVDKQGHGSLTIDSGTVTGTGQVTVYDSQGSLVATATVGNVKTGMQTFDIDDLNLNVPLKPGAYTFSFDVSAPGKGSVPAKTYTTGRITGLSYKNGDPMLLLGDSLSVPFSQLIQIRG